MCTIFDTILCTLFDILLLVGTKFLKVKMLVGNLVQPLNGQMDQNENSKENTSICVIRAVVKVFGWTSKDFHISNCELLE